MRAVWSFWSKPFKSCKGRIWREPSHHLLAWGLSLRLARQHFAETLLVTDTPGKRMLVDALGSRYLELDGLTVPTLVIGSEGDRLTPIGQSRRIARTAPNVVGLVELSGGHCSMIGPVISTSPTL